MKIHVQSLPFCRLGTVRIFLPKLADSSYSFSLSTKVIEQKVQLVNKYRNPRRWGHRIKVHIICTLDKVDIEQFLEISKYRQMKLFCLRQQTGSYVLVGFLCLNIPPFLDFCSHEMELKWDVVSQKHIFFYFYLRKLSTTIVLCKYY